jgi:putative ubiquitin-RnfH superfamily antitoxin RatB of RatAB toxin-antitoxin module
MLEVEIVFGRAEKQTVLKVFTPSPSSVLEAIQQSKIVEYFPEIELIHKNKVGIFGRIVSLDTHVKNNDRIEIYCPLMIDPKQARKLRADPKNKSAKREIKN